MNTPYNQFGPPRLQFSPQLLPKAAHRPGRKTPAKRFKDPKVEASFQNLTVGAVKVVILLQKAHQQALARSFRKWREVALLEQEVERSSSSLLHVQLHRILSCHRRGLLSIGLSRWRSWNHLQVGALLRQAIDNSVQFDSAVCELSEELDHKQEQLIHLAQNARQKRKKAKAFSMLKSFWMFQTQRRKKAKTRKLRESKELLRFFLRWRSVSSNIGHRLQFGALERWHLASIENQNERVAAWHAKSRLRATERMVFRRWKEAFVQRKTSQRLADLHLKTRLRILQSKCFRLWRVSSVQYKGLQRAAENVKRFRTAMFSRKVLREWHAVASHFRRLRLKFGAFFNRSNRSLLLGKFAHWKFVVADAKERREEIQKDKNVLYGSLARCDWIVRNYLYRVGWRSLFQHSRRVKQLHRLDRCLQAHVLRRGLLGWKQTCHLMHVHGLVAEFATARVAAWKSHSSTLTRHSLAKVLWTWRRHAAKRRARKFALNQLLTFRRKSSAAASQILNGLLAASLRRRVRRRFAHWRASTLKRRAEESLALNMSLEATCRELQSRLESLLGQHDLLLQEHRELHASHQKLKQQVSLLKLTEEQGKRHLVSLQSLHAVELEQSGADRDLTIGTLQRLHEEKLATVRAARDAETRELKQACLLRCAALAATNKRQLDALSAAKEDLELAYQQTVQDRQLSLENSNARFLMVQEHTRRWAELTFSSRRRSRLLRRVFTALRCAARRGKRLSRAEDSMRAFRQRAILKMWKRATSRKVAIQRALWMLEQRVAAKKLRSCLSSWFRWSLRSRHLDAIRGCNALLQQKRLSWRVVNKWHRRAQDALWERRRQREMAGMARRRHRRSLKAAMARWRGRVLARKRAGSLFEKRRRAVLKRALLSWLLQTRGRRHEAEMRSLSALALGRMREDRRATLLKIAVRRRWRIHLHRGFSALMRNYRGHLRESVQVLQSQTALIRWEQAERRREEEHASEQWKEGLLRLASPKTRVPIAPIKAIYPVTPPPLVTVPTNTDRASPSSDEEEEEEEEEVSEQRDLFPLSPSKPAPVEVAPATRPKRPRRQRDLLPRSSPSYLQHTASSRRKLLGAGYVVP